LGARGNIRRVVLGEPIGTLVSEAADVFANQAD
jgi:hypothetical protein